MKKRKIKLVLYLSLFFIPLVFAPVTVQGWTWIPGQDYVLTQAEEVFANDIVLVNTTTITNDLDDLSITISCESSSVLQVSYQVVINKLDGDNFNIHLRVNSALQDNMYLYDSSATGWHTISGADFYDCSTTNSYTIEVCGFKSSSTGKGCYIAQRRLTVMKYDPATSSASEFGSIGLTIVVLAVTAIPIAFNIRKRSKKE